MEAQGEGRWSLELELAPGRVLYRIEVDGRPLLDPENPVSAQHEGEPYSLSIIEPCEGPRFRFLERQGSRLVLQMERVEDSPLEKESVKAEALKISLPTEVEHDHIWIDLSPLPPGKHRLNLSARDKAGRESLPFEAPFWTEPFSWRDAIIYEVMLDRFAGDAPFTPADRLKPSGVRLGGTLRGLQAQLEAGYFEHLGVNVLWISPLNENPEGLWQGVEGGSARYESYHAYWPKAPRSPDPRFGSEAEIEALVEAAHARGIRVLMDVVLNHVHLEHPYFREHPSWFGEEYCQCGGVQCPWFSHIEVCWFTDYLPDVRWAEVETLEAQVEDALWWIRRFNLDGLRVDAVPMMPRFVTRYLSFRLHREFEGLGERHLLLGETFTGPEEYALIRWYLGPNGLDGQFDFPLMWATRAAFAWESAPLWELADALKESQEAWEGSGAVMGLFVGNHDVSRFLSEAAEQLDGTREQAWRERVGLPDGQLPYDRLLLAHAFLLGLAGAPTLWQGDEFGMPGANDPDNRRPMRFDGELDPREAQLLEQVARLGRLRRCLPALRRGAHRPLRAEAERLIYLRDLDDGQPAIIMLQRDIEGPAQIRLPPDLKLKAPALVEILSGEQLLLSADGFQVDVPAHRPAFLIPADSPCLEAP